jgi:hypothetical protein
MLTDTALKNLKLKETFVSQYAYYLVVPSACAKVLG